MYHTLSLSNNGDVSLNVDFTDSSTDSISQHCDFVMPEPMKIGPGRTVKCVFGITVKIVGPFKSNLLIKTRENSFAVPISGTMIILKWFIPIFIKGIGIKIVLTKRNKEILESEKLPIVNFV